MDWEAFFMETIISALITAAVTLVAAFIGYLATVSVAHRKLKQGQKDLSKEHADLSKENTTLLNSTSEDHKKFSETLEFLKIERYKDNERRETLEKVDVLKSIENINANFFALQKELIDTKSELERTLIELAATKDELEIAKRSKNYFQRNGEKDKKRDFK